MPATRKRLLKRALPDRSQALRRGMQLAFLLLNVWICAQFYLFVRYYETGGSGIHATRPPGVEGWLPIASLMNLKVLLASGRMPALHPAGMFLLLAFLAISWIFRKSFCGWLCPIGTISEYLWRLGRQTFGRNFRLPRKLDIGLRSLKYLLLALFFYAVGSMSVPAIHAFLEGPYGVVDDVKMLNFFRFLGLTGGIVLAAAGGGFGLRAELLVPVPVPVRRPYGIGGPGQPGAHPPRYVAVYRLRQMQQVVPFGAAGGPPDHHRVGGMHRLPAMRGLLSRLPERCSSPRHAGAAYRPGPWPPGLPGCSSGVTTYARLTHNWRTDLPERVYFELIPHANEFEHPR